jgi:transposase
MFYSLCSRKHNRKNFLFANTPRGARASAITYSLVETAKENGVNPNLYLTYLFEQLPNIQTHDPQALGALLPWSNQLPEAVRKPGKRAEQEVIAPPMAGLL